MVGRLQPVCENTLIVDCRIGLNTRKTLNYPEKPSGLVGTILVQSNGEKQSQVDQLAAST